MFGKKKAPPEQNSRTSRNRGSLSQFGLFDMPQDFDPSGAGGAIPEPTEADLEAELAMLVGGGGKASKKPEAKKRTAIPEGQLNSMVAACMKDYDSDEDIAVDENDDELLGELEGLASDQEEEVSAPIHSSQPAPQPKIEPLTCHGGDIGAECAGQDLLSIIDNRISCYSEAERNAKAAGETGRARRFARGLATLTDQRRKVLSGKAVNDADIPPAVVITAAQSSKKPSPVSTPPDEHQPLPSPLSEPSPVAAPTKPLDPNKLIQPISSPIEENLRRVQQRRTECRSEALKAKETGDKLKALACVNAVKECNALLEKINAGQTVDISNLPEIPTAVIQYPRGEPEPRPPPPAPEQQFSRDDPIQMPENPEDLPPVDPSVYGAPPPPRTVQEALEQRLAKYRQDEEKAKAENNSSRARRLGRICKQYTDAMKAHKAGRPIPVEDLPTPPGFAPIPTGAPAAPRPAAQVAPPKAAGAASAGGDTVPPQPARATPTAPAAAAKPAQKKPTTLRDKQILLLTSRQAEFKKAALEAKKSGQIEQAKEYLRQYKGFDQMIEAAKSGLPIDFKTLPVPPGQGSAASMDFVIISKEECAPGEMSEDRQAMFSKLEKELIAQVRMCETNRQHFKATGDISSANKFHQMVEHSKKDLDALRFAFKREDAVPKFHYEVRSFDRIICNADLTDNDFEFTVVQGINYNVPNPKEIHTYAKLEFPYPKDTPFTDKSDVVKDTNNPEYAHTVVIPVNPKDSSYQRMFKRQSAKVEIWSKGGFLRSDTLLGAAKIKLQDLEQKCQIHDSFALMDAKSQRRAVGGQVEVKLRIRNPIVTKQMERVQEKWLVISFK